MGARTSRPGVLPTFITADVVAETLGFACVGTFLRKRGLLEDEMAFPPPVAFHKRPMKWRLDAVEHWHMRQAEDWLAPLDDGPRGDVEPLTTRLARRLAVIDGGAA